jgi:hypothetical protein
MLWNASKHVQRMELQDFSSLRKLQTKVYAGLMKGSNETLLFHTNRLKQVSKQTECLSAIVETMDAAQKLQVAVNELMRDAYQNANGTGVTPLADQAGIEKTLAAITQRLERLEDMAANEVESDMESDDESSFEEGADVAFKDSLEKLKAIKTLAVMQQGKKQLFATAIQNCEFNSFLFLPWGWGGPIVSSTGFARQVLFAFQRGQGHPLRSATLPSLTLNKEEAKRTFRDKICLQIEELTGLKTVSKQEADGTFVLYYSDECCRDIPPASSVVNTLPPHHEDHDDSFILIHIVLFIVFFLRVLFPSSSFL